MGQLTQNYPLYKRLIPRAIQTRTDKVWREVCRTSCALFADRASIALGRSQRACSRIFDLREWCLLLRDGDSPV